MQNQKRYGSFLVSRATTPSGRANLEHGWKEVQYLHTTITDEQRQEFGHLVEDTIRRIESAEFLPHSGIRFPQNPCSSCPYLGLCLRRQDLVEAALIKRPGAEDLGWLDELTY